MFGALSLGGWLGASDLAGVRVEDRDGENSALEENGAVPGGTREAQPLLSQAKRIGNYLFTVAESMWVTAQTIRKSVVEEHSIDRIMDKDQRNLLRNPPAGVHFHFNFERLAPVAMMMLQEDPTLKKLRYELVPKCIKEEVFWRNYFYRVSLIKQSAQLASLADQQAESQEDKVKGSKDSVEVPGSILSGMALGRTKARHSGTEEVSFIPAVGEFASDVYNLLSTEDTGEGMEQLGVGRREGAVLPEDDNDITEWEKELQRELQQFEALEGQEKASEAWEKEIEDLLQEDD